MAFDLLFYLDATTAPAVSPAYWGSWHRAPDARRQLNTVKQNTTIANTNRSWNGVTDQLMGTRQFVSGVMAAHHFTPADTLKLQVRCLNNNQSVITSAILYAVIRVVSGDGTTFRGTLYAGQGPTQWTNPITNRNLGGEVNVQNTFDMEAGDLIVFELGTKYTQNGTGYVSLYWSVGDNNATDLPEDETTTVVNNPWLGITYATGGAYTLAADPGSYALSGQPGDLLAARRVGADAGAYSLSGQDSGLLRAARIAIEAGGYVLTGQDIALLRASRIGADGGTYVLSGLSADLLFNRLILADTGSYVLTGQDASLIYGFGYLLAAEPGSYVLTGQAIDALFGRVLGAGGGSYAVAGKAVGLVWSGESGGVLRRWTGTAWVRIM